MTQAVPQYSNVCKKVRGLGCELEQAPLKQWDVVFQVWSFECKLILDSVLKNITVFERGCVA